MSEQDEQRKKEELIDTALRNSFEEYFKPIPQTFEGYSGFRVQKEIQIGSLGIALLPGRYYYEVKDKTGKTALERVKNGENVYVFAQTTKGGIPWGALKEEGNGYFKETVIDGQPVYKQIKELPKKWKLEPALERIPVATNDVTGEVEYLELSEVIVWAAINKAYEAGDTDTVETLIEETYGIKKGTYQLVYEADKTELPKQDTIKPRHHVQTISRLSKQFVNIDTKGKPIDVEMTGNKESYPVYTRVSLNYESEGVSLSRKMTAYDREVHNAVASLERVGNRVITPAQVYRTMTGKISTSNKKSAASISKSALSKVEESIDKQRRTFAKIDYSEELRGRGGEFDGEKITAKNAFIESYMLNATKGVITTANGKKVSAYELRDTPVLYKHDMITKQLITYPQRLLEATSEVIQPTERNILIRSYLFERIKTMNRPHSKLSKRIRYGKVHEAVGLTSPDRATAKRINDVVKACLKVFEKEGFIAGWSEYEEPGSAHKKAGIEIKTTRIKKK